MAENEASRRSRRWEIISIALLILAIVFLLLATWMPAIVAAWQDRS